MRLAAAVHEILLLFRLPSFSIDHENCNCFNLGLNASLDLIKFHGTSSTFDLVDNRTPPTLLESLSPLHPPLVLSPHRTQDRPADL